MTERSPTLMLIAEALGVPVEAFTDTRDPPNDRVALCLETAELLDAFQKIADRQARRRCLSYVKSAAERDGPR